MIIRNTYIIYSFTLSDVQRLDFTIHHYVMSTYLIVEICLLIIYSGLLWFELFPSSHVSQLYKKYGYKMSVLSSMLEVVGNSLTCRMIAFIHFYLHTLVLVNHFLMHIFHEKLCIITHIVGLQLSEHNGTMVVCSDGG